MFVLSSDITIGKFRFSGVNEVIIRRSLHSIADTALIRIPSLAKILKNNRVASETIVTGNQFSDGDPVTIKLGYDTSLQTEFTGFVKRRNLNMPLEIECEGYSWLLRRNNINIFEKTISVKDLLLEAVSGIPAGYTINVECSVDLRLENVYLPNTSGFDVINTISNYTDGCLTCFFIRPDTLWCGLAYTSFADGDDVFNMGSVDYRLGYNVVKSNSLKERHTDNDPVKVTYNSRRSNGNKISQTSDLFTGFVRTHSKVLNSIKDEGGLKLLANEKAHQLNYAGYEGSVNAFLQPYALPGTIANLVDDRYTERNGTYIIEGTQVQFGIHGGRRTVELGPQTGFAKIKV